MALYWLRGAISGYLKSFCWQQKSLVRFPDDLSKTTWSKAPDGLILMRKRTAAENLSLLYAIFPYNDIKNIKTLTMTLITNLYKSFSCPQSKEFRKLLLNYFKMNSTFIIILYIHIHTYKFRECVCVCVWRCRGGEKQGYEAELSPLYYSVSIYFSALLFFLSFKFGFSDMQW